MQDQEKPAHNLTNFPYLIASLSVCLLAAGFGAKLDADWQVVWSELGAFGLAAAVGLESIHRFRKNRAMLLRNRAMRERLENGLSRLSEESATLDSLNAAVHELTADLIAQQDPMVRKPGRSRRQWEFELLSQHPLTISSVDGRDDTAAYGVAEPIEGLLQQISSSAISFRHAELLVAQVALVTFQLSSGRKLAFVVDVIWTERTQGGFLSGGTMLAVGVPPEHDAETRELACV